MARSRGARLLGEVLLQLLLELGELALNLRAPLLGLEPFLVIYHRDMIIEMCVCIYIYIYVDVYAYVHIHVYAYVYIYIYKHISLSI